MADAGRFLVAPTSTAPFLEGVTLGQARLLSDNLIDRGCNSGVYQTTG